MSVTLEKAQHLFITIIHAVAADALRLIECTEIDGGASVFVVGVVMSREDGHIFVVPLAQLLDGDARKTLKAPTLPCPHCGTDVPADQATDNQLN